MAPRAPKNQKAEGSQQQGDAQVGDTVNVKVVTATGNMRVGDELEISRDRYEKVLKPFVTLIGEPPAAEAEAESAAEAETKAEPEANPEG